MRKIDRYVGVPITVTITLMLKVWQFFFRSQAQRPKRILFVELSEMGSTILADPAMRKARDYFGAELFFVIFTKNRPSLSLLQTIPDANIFTINQSSMLSIVVDVIRFRCWCLRKRVDTVVDFELFSRFSALLSFLSGAMNRVGFYAFHDEGLYRGEMLTHRVAYNPHIHIAKNFIALINALAAEKPEFPFSKKEVLDSELALPVVKPRLSALAAMRDKIRIVAPQYDETIHRLLLINPNSSELLPQRRWSPENYQQLIRQIVNRYSDIIVLITGAPSELPGAEALVAAISHERCANLTGHLIIEELPVLYTLSVLMVTNDSGPGHFSAITRMPTIVLYGPETPKLYGSLGNVYCMYANLACSPCVSAANHRKTSCTDNVCLQAIAPSMVFATVREILESHGHS